MNNPYSGKPDYQFWRRSFAGRAATEVDPVTGASFSIGRNDKVATAGSCFAQHVSRTLSEMGFNYMVTEQRPASPSGPDENYGTFSARYGNIYTVRQLKQLIQRAYGLFTPTDTAWQRADGRYVDPFRPYIQADGFASPEDVMHDREAHLAAVRDVFENCEVFIFTLGLTEAWQAVADGAVLPICPGVVGAQVEGEAYRFHNFSVAETEADLNWVMHRLHALNPACKVLLTVSPVALIATYEDSHVLTATTYSKSVLRVVADMAARSFDFVDYFPSYEMILGPQGRGAFLEDDLREIRPEGVKYAMSKFAAHYLSDGSAGVAPPPVAATAAAIDRQRVAMKTIADIICDEENIDPCF
ncbi:GSCFA domain-containing protein [Asticcacaulis sp. EMRT-3]|uniref:GSCFA domain-containing protein n=1 Tax=Asticcacaulis sp. EMRT-3 TaxID=3040349 RepID=UPI0024AF54CC|nr:GSCFA domain-containing protein [Asticcacaulis sp. EMRT-3]MDI7776359.1 GSCFA domain-containing protein [Asticcacaulis sp. EMRT-3]